MSNQAQALRLAEEAKAIYERAELEGRDPTPAEQGEVATLLAKAKNARRANGPNELEAALSGDGYQRGVGPNFNTSGGPGDAFVKSEGYKKIADPASRGQTWTSGAIEVDTKTTLTSTPGTALTPAGYTTGVVSTLFEQPYLADVLPTQQAPGNPVRFVSETTATNAAAATAEGGLKPESTLVFGETSEPVRKIATILPVSDELLEDAPQIQAYLNQRLSLFVRQQEEQQLLLGNGTAPNLQGFVASGRAIGTFTRSAGTANELAIFKAANGVRGSSFLNPDTVVINPAKSTN